MLQICENIRQARDSAGFTQAEMADLLGVKRTTYANWESTTEPNIATIKKISQILGVEFSQLINEKPTSAKLSETEDRLLRIIESQQRSIEMLSGRPPDLGVAKNG